MVTSSAATALHVDRALSNGRRPLPRLVASQHRREAVALAAAAVGALLVVGIWWIDTAARDLHTLGDQLTAAGRVSGLLGTYLVLIQVVLMARIPWLDRFIGSDRLSYWHRANGQYSISLLVAHALFVLWGYAVTDHASALHESNVMLRSYPDVLAATVGLLLFVAVGVSSARAARRKLRYETWHFIHLYTYLAIALSFAHQLATGNDFITHTGNRIVWVALYVLTGSALVGFRVVVPLRDAWRHQLRITRVVRENDSAVSVYLTGANLNRIPAEAGQFFRWRFLTRDGWWQAHPFSLSAAPNRKFLRITVKGMGDHSARMSELRPGTRVIAEGPYGSFTPRRRTRRKVLFIAGGTGITPLRAMLEVLPGAPGDVTLLYRATRETDLLFRHELEELARHRGVTVRYLLGPRDGDPDPLGPPLIRHVVPDIRHHDVYVCGPAGMMDAALRTLRTLGVRRSQIHTERFEL